ncbi:MAG TPA: CsbD family protein [Actinomycetota bacterium]|jgi:uncharacterized protein YjbJ (UPF0337 family)
MEDRIEGKWDEAKGKAKEAAGDLTDDPDLEREGEKDQMKGAGKQAVGHVKEAGRKVKEAVEDAT